MFSIESASKNDCQAIRNLASQIWEDTYGGILSKDQLDYMFEMMYSVESLSKQMDEQQFFIISTDNGEPVGYLSIEKKDDTLFYFQKIYALPRMQGTGIGRYMVEQAIVYLEGIYPKPFAVQLNVNRYNKAVGFYKHLGFYEIATRDEPIGNGYFMNDYIMRMDIV